VHVPQRLPTDAELSLVHCPDYLQAFSSLTLDDQRVRRCVWERVWSVAEGTMQPGLEGGSTPSKCSRSTLAAAVCLSVRRIGFGAATRTQLLVDRTKAEVAGTLLTAQLALRHGLACNTAGGLCLAGSSLCGVFDQTIEQANQG
jgi:hypothetical protein